MGGSEGRAGKCDDANGARCRPFRAWVLINVFRGFLAALVTHG
jgi:hypothetical protein